MFQVRVYQTERFSTVARPFDVGGACRARVRRGHVLVPQPLQRPVHRVGRCGRDERGETDPQGAWPTRNLPDRHPDRSG